MDDFWRGIWVLIVAGAGIALIAFVLALIVGIPTAILVLTALG